MNPTQLLEHFDRFTEVPGSVSDLRTLIIHLGVTGKLVQHEGEGLSGDAFYLKIQEGIARLATGCNRCRWSASNRIAPKEAPFSIPDHWTWARINDTGLYINGVAFKPTDWKNEGLPIIRIQNLSDETKEFNYVEGSFADENIIRYGDLLVSWSATLDAFLWHRAEGILNQHIFKVIVNEDAVARNYLYWLLKHEIKSLADSEHAHGLAMKHINRGPFLAHVVPIPPLAEQHRIVAKIDELMVLCDQLQAAQNEREAKRDRLVAASLNRIGTAPVAADDAATAAESATPLRDAAHFHLDHLPRLTSRPEHIKQVRQTILNLAVRGRLVSQDPNDELAIVLLERIADEKALLAKKRKTQNLETAVSTGDMNSYVLPAGWAWSNAQDVCQLDQIITYGILKPVWLEFGVPTVRVTEMKTGTIDVASLPRCDPARAAKFGKTTLAVGDLLISKDGTIGKTAFVPAGLEGGNITQHVLRFPINNTLNRHFVRICIDAPVTQKWLNGETKGVALQGVNVGDFRRMPIPVPPLAEQHRIVAKVDELMALCDQLEAQLTTTQTDSRRLLEAVLHQALAAAA